MPMFEKHGYLIKLIFIDFEILMDNTLIPLVSNIKWVIIGDNLTISIRIDNKVAEKKWKNVSFDDV